MTGVASILPSLGVVMNLASATDRQTDYQEASGNIKTVWLLQRLFFVAVISLPSATVFFLAGWLRVFREGSVLDFAAILMDYFGQPL